MGEGDQYEFSGGAGREDVAIVRLAEIGGERVAHRHADLDVGVRLGAGVEPAATQQVELSDHY